MQIMVNAFALTTYTAFFSLAATDILYLDDDNVCV